MSVDRHLLHGKITYSQAKDEEVNIVHRLGYCSQRNDFFEFIRARRSLIEEKVAHHLKVSSNSCHAADIDSWMHGSFNLCVPVEVEDFGHVIIRFPLPYRVGDGFHSGNSVKLDVRLAHTHGCISAALVYRFRVFLSISHLHGFIHSGAPTLHPVLHSYADRHHLPRHDQLLRIQIEGFPIAIQRLLSRISWHLDLRLNIPTASRPWSSHA